VVTRDHACGAPLQITSPPHVHSQSLLGRSQSLLAQVLWHLGYPDQALEQAHQQAFDVARGQQAKALELRAAMSLSQPWQRQGKRDSAGRLLGEVCGWFTEGFDTAALKAAKAVLEGLS
jgi:hypothetical protein